jgi:hypothetical protein
MICGVKLSEFEGNSTQRKGKILTYVNNILIEV